MFSFEDAEEGAIPFYAYYYKNVVKAEKTGARTRSSSSFDVRPNNRELPDDHRASSPSCPSTTGTGNRRERQDPRDIMSRRPWSRRSGPAPIGSRNVKPGRSRSSFERVEGLLGQGFADQAVGRWTTSMKSSYRLLPRFHGRAGGVQGRSSSTCYFETSSAKNWANAYEFQGGQGMIGPGLEPRSGRLKNAAQPMQAFVFNTRRAKFKPTAALRRAFNYAFDFEWANKNLFFGSVSPASSRASSQNSDLASRPDVPERSRTRHPGAVASRTRYPTEVFTTPYTNPKSDGDQRSIAARTFA